jgi:hypothetical protein
VRSHPAVLREWCWCDYWALQANFRSLQFSHKFSCLNLSWTASGSCSTPDYPVGCAIIALILPPPPFLVVRPKTRPYCSRF